jgi:DNA invertase Pin-like site-specific DNA recombinase
MRRYSKQAHLTSGWADILNRPPLEADIVARPPARVHKIARRLSEQSIRQIVDSYTACVSAREIGEQVGISKASVLKILREQGVPIRRQGLRIGHEFQ